MDWISFLNQWQTLIGAAAGPFLAVAFSAIGFGISSLYSSHKERKEAIRISEVSITQTLNDLYMTRKKLEDFVRRLRGLATEINAINDDHTYCLQSTNFPAVRDIFFNFELVNKKFGSSYLHNNTIFGSAAIKEINSWLGELKANFSTLLENNRFIVTLDPKPHPHHQRSDFASDLNGFADAIEGILAYFKIVIEGATQIKVYGGKLRKHPIITPLIREGSSFRYFKTYADRAKYTDPLVTYERVSAIIKPDVDEALADAEQKYQASQ